jgi:hypothetical protein
MSLEAVVEAREDEILGCSNDINEEQFFECTRDFIGKNLSLWTHPKYRVSSQKSSNFV